MPRSSDRRRAERRAARRSTAPGAATGQDEAVAAHKPDTAELRYIRAAYFGGPVAERKKVVRPVVTTPAARATSSPSISSKSWSEPKHKRKHTSRSASEKAKNTSKRNLRDYGNYVYGTAMPAQGSRSTSSKLAQDRGKKSESPRSKRPSHTSSFRRSDHPHVPVEELAPEDSISQVAERRADRAEARPNLRRSRTTSNRLAPVQKDKHGEQEGPSTAARKSTKRDSTLFASMFRRNSANAVPTQPTFVECLTCGSDDVPPAKSAKLSCGHRMCHGCLKRIFNMSVTDPAHMPPKCCTENHIPLKHVDKLFSDKFKTNWNRKYEEYNTKNRVYCPSPKCGEWIKPSHMHTYMGRKYGLCQRCKTKVCVLCNDKMHKSSDCPKDPEIQKLVQQAQDEGWQRCYNCSALVELKEGCNHMTCRCTAEFCMICGAKWKSCDCPWFNYTSLPHPDRLNGMRVPEPVQVLYRRVFPAAGPMTGEGANAPQGRLERRLRPGPMPEQTYQQEMDARREQERADEELARRMQFANLADEGVGEGGDRPSPHSQGADRETWGIGNQAGHFLNENFVRNAANVVMSTFGDANMGRRGERSSGRRRRAELRNQNAGDAGLVPNFLGDESVLGAGPSRRAPGR